MTLLRERPEVREVPKLKPPRRPWFGWIVSLVVLLVAGGIWLIVRDTGTDGSYEANELARFERIEASAVAPAPIQDGFDQAELDRFTRIEQTSAQALPTPDGFDQAELNRFTRIETSAQLFTGAPNAEVCFSCGTEGWGTG